MPRGRLRIYLGAAPGVGKTFAMLNEGRRRHDRGTEVVIGFVETHNRVHTAEQIGDLEIVPRARFEYRGTTLEEMDVDAVIKRAPVVALVDELAHTNVPGARNAKRWQDVEELLAAGIDVVSTLNIQHLESLNDLVERITGLKQHETVPDAVVRQAEQIELVDMTPEAIGRRMAHGNIYPPEQVDTALSNYFRPGNLAALRELALLWVADQVDEGLEAYRARHGITDPWETRERVLVAVTGAPGTELLIRRAARMAQRTHAELLGVHVASDDGLAGARSDPLERNRQLLVDLGGAYHEIVAADVAAALASFARAENCTQLVLGASARSRWNELARGSVINRVVRLSGPIDVHIISQVAAVSEAASAPARRRLVPRSSLPPRRQVAGFAVAAGGIPLLTFALTRARDEFTLGSVLLLYVLLVVVAAAIGGPLPALVAAVAAFLAVNYFFIPPIHTLTISEHEHVLTLAVFLVVAIVVSAFVDIAARRARDATRARAEAETLAHLAATIEDGDPLSALVDHLRSAFALDGASVLIEGDAGAWTVEAASGRLPPASPAEADLTQPLGEGVILALRGARLSADDRRVLNAFAAQLSAARERARLAQAAGHATALSEANELRTALLQAVSHDLRTPLASIKASVSSLRQPDITWSVADTQEFLATIEDETDRLTALVVNLLDMSRLQAGVLQPTLRAVNLEDVVPAALASLGPRAQGIQIDSFETVPPVRTDAALLERVIANLVENALRWSPPGCGVRVRAGAVDGRVEIRVVDNGPGIPPDARTRIFEPFQRLGDQGGTGVGLGLAVARGLLHAMHGELSIEDTPGGGTTAIVDLEQTR